MAALLTSDPEGWVVNKLWQDVATFEFKFLHNRTKFSSYQIFHFYFYLIAICFFWFANNCLKFTNIEDDLHAKKPFAATLHPICLHFGQ